MAIDGGQLSLFTLSMKFGKYRDNIITIRTDSQDELIEAANYVEQGSERLRQLDEVLNPEPMDLITKPVDQGGLGGVVVSETQGGKVCAHGAMVYKTGVSKAGKSWTAYMCVAPKGQTCSPIWL